MDPYLPLAVWLVSALLCIYIARVRHVKPTLFRKLAVVILGPFAIPLALLTRSDA